MVHRSPDAAYLAACRKDVACAPTARTRNLDAIRARIAAGDHVRADGDGDRTSASGKSDKTSMWSRRVAAIVAIAKPVALSVGLASATLGVVKAGALTVRSRNTPPPVTQAQPQPVAASKRDRRPTAKTATTEVAATRAPVASLPSPATTVPTTTVPTATVPTTTRPDDRVTTLPTAAATAATSPTAQSIQRPTDDVLAREIALMDRAQRELHRADYPALLLTLSQHRTEFSGGAMLEEARAWNAVAQCKLGRKGAAAAVALFTQHHRRSALAGKVRDACDPSGAWTDK